MFLWFWENYGKCEPSNLKISMMNQEPNNFSIPTRQPEIFRWLWWNFSFWPSWWCTEPAVSLCSIHPGGLEICPTIFFVKPWVFIKIVMLESPLLLVKTPIWLIPHFLMMRSVPNMDRTPTNKPGSALEFWSSFMSLSLGRHQCTATLGAGLFGDARNGEEIGEWWGPQFVSWVGEHS